MSENLHKRRSSMRTRGIGVGAAEKQMFKHNALKKGKRVFETIRNPKASETNKPFIRRPMKRKAA
jgi:hypothetical protein